MILHNKRARPGLSRRIERASSSLPGSAHAIAEASGLDVRALKAREGSRGPLAALQDYREAMLSPFAMGQGASDLDFARCTDDRILGTEERSFLGTNGAGGLFSIRPRLAGKKEVTSPFHENWVVFACSNLRRSSFASVPIQFFPSDDPEAEAVSDQDPIARLFAKPTPFWSRSQAFGAGSVHLDVSGENFWFLTGPDGEPMRASKSGLIDLPSWIMPVSGGVVTDVRDERGVVETWRYAAANGPRGSANAMSPDFSPESVVHFSSYDPSDPQRGVGPVQVATRQVSIVFQLERYLESVSRAGGPGAWMISKKPKIRDEQDRMQLQIDEATSDPDNASRIKLISGDYELVPNPANPKDLQSIEGLKFGRDVIASIMRTPLPCIGVLESATYRNMEEAWRQFWLAIAADCMSVADVVNSHFFPRLRDSRFARYRMRFDFSKIDALREDKTERLKAAADIASKGAPISLNQAARTLGVGLEEQPEGDIILVPSTMATLDDVKSGKVRPPPSKGEIPGAPPKPPKGKAPKGKARGYDGRVKGVPPLSKAERRAVAKAFVERVLDRPERELQPKAAAWAGDVVLSAKKLLHSFAKGRIELAAKDRKRKPIKLAKGRKLTAAQRKDVRADDSRQIDALLELRRLAWESLLREASSDIIERVYSVALKNAASEISAISLPMTDPRIQSALASQMIELVEGPTSTLASEVRNAVLEALGEPTSIGTLQQRIAEVLPELDARLERVFGTKEARALTIARTEVGHAASSAKFVQYSAEHVARTQWVDAGDDVVRPAHHKLDGRIVALGDEFELGLRFPRDPHGSAGQVCNCRCDWIAIIPES